MTTHTGFSIRGRNPDVLSCIANLSNDEVFTPPEFAERMLDNLAEAWASAYEGENIWSNPKVTFLDPFTKSGVFLRQITSRLVDGLAGEYPDLDKRVDHVLTKQVFGIGTTYLTSLIARRSVYCSKWANGEHSIATSFDNDQGNIWFERIGHTWTGGTEWVYTADENGNQVKKFTNGRCEYCGASQKVLDRGEALESHAYAFIHAREIKDRIGDLFGEGMQFDVIIGNPPYQLEDGGYGTSAAPIYQKFVEQAKNLEPRMLTMVIPARWYSGGKGLDDFRHDMLHDRSLRSIHDFPKLYDAFPGVKIRGGICYFLWDRSHDGPCSIQTMWDGEPLGPPVTRYLDAYDIIIRRNEAVSILDKVSALDEPSLRARVSSRKPFGLPTNFHGASSEFPGAIKFYGSQRISWVRRSDLEANVGWVDEWKVLMTAVQGTSAAVETKFLSKPIIAGPGTACSETYLVAGHFATEVEAINFASLLRTRFVRFLVSLRKPTQHATRDVYSFVPELPLDMEWTDSKLYDRYALTADEVAFLESQVAAHEDALTWRASSE